MEKRIPLLKQVLRPGSNFPEFKQHMSIRIGKERTRILGPNALDKVTTAILYTIGFNPNASFSRESFADVACFSPLTSEALPPNEVDAIISIAKEAGVLTNDYKNSDRLRIKDKDLNERLKLILADAEKYN